MNISIFWANNVASKAITRHISQINEYWCAEENTVRTYPVRVVKCWGWVICTTRLFNYCGFFFFGKVLSQKLHTKSTLNIRTHLTHYTMITQVRHKSIIKQFRQTSALCIAHYRYCGRMWRLASAKVNAGSEYRSSGISRCKQDVTEITLR